MNLYFNRIIDIPVKESYDTIFGPYGVVNGKYSGSFVVPDHFPPDNYHLAVNCMTGDGIYGGPRERPFVVENGTVTTTPTTTTSTTPTSAPPTTTSTATTAVSTPEPATTDITEDEDDDAADVEKEASTSAADPVPESRRSPLAPSTEKTSEGTFPRSAGGESGGDTDWTFVLAALAALAVGSLLYWKLRRQRQKSS